MIEYYEGGESCVSDAHVTATEAIQDTQCSYGAYQIQLRSSSALITQERATQSCTAREFQRRTQCADWQGQGRM